MAPTMAELAAVGDEPATAGSNGRRTGVRPQTYVLTFCGIHLLGRQEAVFTGSFIEVLRRVDVAEHAARSALARMVKRGLLERHRQGKKMYLGLTDRVGAILEQGGARAWQTPVNRNWDGRWTLLAFSLPETRRADRHLLRSRLLWARFGLLQNGLWLAASPVDVPRLLEGLDVLDHVSAFHATTLPPTQAAQLIREAWNLDALRQRYTEFLDRWDRPDPMPDAEDDLARQLRLASDWLVLHREDPGLPLEHLPADWPAVRAEHVALRLRRAYADSAQRVADTVLDRILVDPDQPPVTHA
ncbi:PaaX family transcriptional regulator C-terminal domain-containing protein [Micromonospora sp. NPDC049679]|uniref:PaaX family transcriptional regulator n=1 Tax=Micromonospora sp. NPDC049679 TaxID=3155920 RepID=UPI0034069FD9